MSDQYILRCTAGPTYTDQSPLNPNTDSSPPITITSAHATISLRLRIQNYRGLPAHSPSTSAYFSHPSHTNDLYSLQWTLTPTSTSGINAHDLVLGNDFDHPIRDRLPPGSEQALKIMKWFVDPGLEGDIYSDTPGLFGPVLSSVNIFRVGGKGGAVQEQQQQQQQEQKQKKLGGEVEVDVLEEGAETEDAVGVRTKAGVPKEAAARKKYFLTERHLREFTFEKDRSYEFDFFNPFLDFNEFAIKLPGFSVIPGITIPIIKYWDGQPLRSHSIRYVLKNRATNETLFVVIITLVPKDEAEGKHNDDGSVQTGKLQGTKPIESLPETKPITNDDDVD